MSINIRYLPVAFLPVALCLSLTTRAEMGTGTIEDPATGKYTDRVYQDWQEGVVLDPTTGNYIVTYKGDYGFFAQILFVPSTKIKPTLRSVFYSSPRNQAIVYQYSLKNGRESQQRIAQFIVHVTTVNPGFPNNIGDWEGTAVSAITGPDFLLSWTNSKLAADAGLAPGRTLSGLVVESNDLPGLTVAAIHGNGRGITWLGDPPDPQTQVGQQINQLLNKDYVTQTAVAPEIRVPTPFDASVVLTNIQKHVDRDLVGLKLIDPTFASELDRWFRAAIAAAASGNQSAVRSDLDELHRLLEHEHKGLDRGDEKGEDATGRDRGRSGLIDRLAAQVLSFDLQYVANRLKEQGDKDQR